MMLLHKASLYQMTFAIVCLWCWSLPRLSASLDGKKSSKADTLSARQVDDTESNGDYDNTESHGVIDNTESNGDYDNTESHGVIDNTESNGDYDNTESNGDYDNTESNGDYDNMESNGDYDNTESNGDYDNTESHGVIDNTESNGDYDNTESNGDYDNTESNGDYDNTESNGDYDNTESNGDYDNTESNGDYDNTESNGDYDNTESNGDYDNTESNGDYDNMESNGDYDNTESNGDYDNTESNGDYDNTESNGDYDNMESNGDYDNTESNGDYDNTESNGDYDNMESNGVYDNTESNGDYDNMESNGDHDYNMLRPRDPEAIRDESTSRREYGGLDLLKYDKKINMARAENGNNRVDDLNEMEGTELQGSTEMKTRIDRSTESLKEGSTPKHNSNTGHITRGAPEVATPEGELKDGDSSTDSSDELTEREVKEMRLTLFQYSFTEKLRASNINISQIIGSKLELPKFPAALMGQMFKHEENEEEFEDDFYAKDEEVIITGDDIGHDCANMKDTLLGCYTFDLKELMNYSIDSVKLWFYKGKDGHGVHTYELFLYDLGSNTSGHPAEEDSMIFRSELDSKDTKDNWVAMDISHHAKKWMDEGADTRTLAFQCNTCTTKHHRDLYVAKDGYAPVLVVKYLRAKNERRVRRKRQECNPNVECCHRNMFADFTYVTALSGLNRLQLDVGYCFGTCPKNFTLELDHGFWKQNMPGLPEHKVRWLRRKRKPCCAPTTLLGVNLHRMDQGRVVATVIGEMMVRKCGCVM